MRGVETGLDAAVPSLHESSYSHCDLPPVRPTVVLAVSQADAAKRGFAAVRCWPKLLSCFIGSGPSSHAVGIAGIVPVPPNAFDDTG